MVWYEAPLQPDGTVVGIVDPRRHKHSGTYVAHVYAGVAFVAATQFNVAPQDILPEAERRLYLHCQKVYDEVGRDLRDLYDWEKRNFKYTRRGYHLVPPPGYTREQWYAVEGFENHQGNCYTWSATFAALARGAGYDAQYVEGDILGIGYIWQPHGFVLIHMDGSTYICDPELEAVSQKPRDLFMQPASKPRVRVPVVASA